MPTRIAALLAVLLATACSSSAPIAREPLAPEPTASVPLREQEQQPEARTQSATSGWSEVPPTASDTGVTPKRKSRVVASSDPSKHGQSLHFRFLVNNTPISGVFVVPGGQTATFTIPVGTVHFSVDECEWEPQGFELAPDQEMPISCKLGKDGDCCEVAIPDDESSKPAKRN